MNKDLYIHSSILPLPLLTKLIHCSSKEKKKKFYFFKAGFTMFDLLSCRIIESLTVALDEVNVLKTKANKYLKIQIHHVT